MKTNTPRPLLLAMGVFVKPIASRETHTLVPGRWANLFCPGGFYQNKNRATNKVSIPSPSKKKIQRNWQNWCSEKRIEWGKGREKTRTGK